MSSNNVVNENGDSFIPASQRPDGTWRKARRVKEGYVPQEEVPLYESKGKQFLNRSSKPEPVRLLSGETANRPIPGLFIIDHKDKKPTTTTTKKKSIDELAKQLEHTKISEKNDKSTLEAVDPAKKLKNLKKKIREIETLEGKIRNGSIAKPEPEQLSKIQRKNDILMQIHELEKQLG